MAEVKAFGLRGMNNLDRTPSMLVDDLRVITPRIVLNADAMDGAVLIKREGFAKVVSLSRPFSLWAGTVMLCVADGLNYPQSLYRIMGEVAEELCEVPGPRVPLTYVEIYDKVYIGNPYFRAAYDLLHHRIVPWGLPLPPAPQVTISDGDLSPGVYFLRYTYATDNLLGGAGPMTKIRIDGTSQGIRLVDRPPNSLCWMTQQDGGDFYLAHVVDDEIIGPYPAMQKLPSWRVIPVPPIRHMAYAFGRIWIASGPRLYYSDPQTYDWFRDTNYLVFPEELVMVAPVTTGLFVSSKKSTWYMEGVTPAKLAMQRRGNGAIPGTLTYAQIEGGGYEISRKMSQLPSPVWIGPKGVVVGTHHGHLVHMTEARLMMAVRRMGTALARSCRGLPQLVMTLWGPSVKAIPELQNAFTWGQLFPPQPVSHEGRGGVRVG